MSEVPRVLTMAREIRRGDASHSPNEMYRAAGGDSALYSHAMREAGFVVPKATGRAEAVCGVCGFDFGQDAPRRPAGAVVSAEAPDDTCPDCGLPMEVHRQWRREQGRPDA